jgi:hypothetical protein
MTWRRLFRIEIRRPIQGLRNASQPRTDRTEGGGPMSQPEIDPSVTAWKSFESPAANHPLPTPNVDLRQWKWGWNVFVGFHYGPIPVGLLIGIPLLIALAR